jgi:hypothetical protein
MSEETPTLPMPGVTKANTVLTFIVPGNPNMVEQTDTTVALNKDNVQNYNFTYSYVDPSTNTVLHSHEMTKTTGSFL